MRAAAVFGEVFTLVFPFPCPSLLAYHLPSGLHPVPTCQKLVELWTLNDLWQTNWRLRFEAFNESDLGFFTVSSTLSRRQVASEAAVIALAFTIAGSLEEFRIEKSHKGIEIFVAMGNLPDTGCVVVCNVLVHNINSKPGFQIHHMVLLVEAFTRFHRRRVSASACSRYWSHQSQRCRKAALQSPEITIRYRSRHGLLFSFNV